MDKITMDIILYKIIEIIKNDNDLTDELYFEYNKSELKVKIVVKYNRK